jgi:hypothetical protein
MKTQKEKQAKRITPGLVIISLCCLMVILIFTGLVFGSGSKVETNHKRPSLTTVYQDLQANVDAFKASRGDEFNQEAIDNKRFGIKNIPGDIRYDPEMQERNEVVDIPGPKPQREFSWPYNNRWYKAVMTLDEKLYQDYRRLPQDNHDFGTYLNIQPQDSSISSLARQFRDIAQQNNLDDYQLVELTMAFVQAIPYDSNRVMLLGSGKNLDYLTPYEVLYQNTGICLDKSVLGVSLLRELGYGSALLLYLEPINYATDSSSHASIGLQVPSGQGLKSAPDYGYVESTTRAPLGLVPIIDSVKVIDSVSLKESVGFIMGFRDRNNFQNDSSLGPVSIKHRTTGKVYRYPGDRTAKPVVKLLYHNVNNFIPDQIGDLVFGDYTTFDYKIMLKRNS